MPSLKDMDQFNSLFVPLEEMVRRNMGTPSTWPSASKPIAKGGNINAYGLRPDGAFIVDLDKDLVLPFSMPEDLGDLGTAELAWGQRLEDYMHTDVGNLIALMTIASSASPGGLYLKGTRSPPQAEGKIIVLPSMTSNVDIAYGNPAQAVYGIAAPAASPGTSVWTNVVLLTPEQMKGMDSSEFASGNYTVAKFGRTKSGGAPVEITGPDNQVIAEIAAIGYEGREALLETGNGPLALAGIPSNGRRFAAEHQEGYLQVLGEAIGLFGSGNRNQALTSGFVDAYGKAPADAGELFSWLRTSFEGSPEDKKIASGLIAAVKQAMKDTGRVVEQSLGKQLGLETVLDPYKRTDGKLVMDDGKPVLNAYDAAQKYKSFQLRDAIVAKF